MLNKRAISYFERLLMMLTGQSVLDNPSSMCLQELNAGIAHGILVKVVHTIVCTSYACHSANLLSSLPSCNRMHVYMCCRARVAAHSLTAAHADHVNSKELEAL
jgi:hypothetical protein